MFGSKPSKGASAIVTGAGSGIGAAFAHALARRGGRVVCSHIRLETAEATANAILRAGGSAHAVACDVSDLTQVEALAAAAEERFRCPPTLVVNNAGVGIGGRAIGEIPLQDWQWAVGVNMWGVIHGCHVFAPTLKAQGKGGIINVCSAASFAAAPLMGPYNVTKAAVLALSETLAAELAGTGVTVTALCPTWVKTNIARDGRIPEGTNRVAQKMMDLTGLSAESVARTTLNAFDRGQLYVLPQVDARLVWRMKRLAPASYARGAGLVGRWLKTVEE